MKTKFPWWVTILTAITTVLATNYVSNEGNNDHQQQSDSTHNDSTIVITAPAKVSLGIMPFKVANDYGVTVTRDAFQFEMSGDNRYVQNVIDRFNSYDTVLININHFSGGFTDHPSLFKDSVRFIIDGSTKAAAFACENEEMQPEFHYGTIQEYCAELSALSNEYPNKFTNGGFTIPLYLWYWSQTHDTDFVLKVMEQNVQAATIKNKFLDRANDQGYEINILKDLPLYAINVHFYLKDTIQVIPIIRMLKYLRLVTGGKEIISNEVGIYANDQNLVAGIVKIANAVGMKYAILYSGTGGVNKAMPITKGMFEYGKLQNN